MFLTSSCFNPMHASVFLKVVHEDGVKVGRMTPEFRLEATACSTAAMSTVSKEGVLWAVCSIWGCCKRLILMESCRVEKDPLGVRTCGGGLEASSGPPLLRLLRALAFFFFLDLCISGIPPLDGTSTIKVDGMSSFLLLLTLLLAKLSLSLYENVNKC